MKRVGVGLVLAILASAGAAPAPAGNAGEQVVVVYNKRVPESKAVAQHYAQRRQVPAAQVFGVDLPNTDDISRAEYRDRLENPLARFLESRKLWRFGPVTVPASATHPAKVSRLVVSSRIRYAVLCYGVPLRIAEDPDLKEDGAGKGLPDAHRSQAAVDSELALLPLVEEKYPLGGPLRNPVYSATNAAAVDPTNGVLIVARLDGPSAAIARGLVDKAIEAETNGLWGRAYFDLRNTTVPGLKPGDDWIRTASEICRRLGFETVLDEKEATFPAGFPMSHIALYLGWYDESVSGPLAQPTVEFMPGAFAYHLHSFSACSLRVTNRYWVGPLLAKGATITMGCVAEPYLGFTPDLGMFVSRLFYSGFSFGEAAYVCQRALSWQTTVVGDPLYRPFGRNLDQLFLELEARDSPLRPWAFLRLLDLNLANGKPLVEGEACLEQLELTRRSAVLSEKLADLYAALGKPSSAVHAYAQALALDPSPQQRVRLRLTLGEKLADLDRPAEAYEDYCKLLEDDPRYPDKLAIYRRLLALARKLNKRTEAEHYEAALGLPAGTEGSTSAK